MADLILHAGFSKTGTSAIQAALRNGRRALKSQGIHYPEPPKLAERLVPGQAGNGVFIQRYLYTPRQGNHAAIVRKFLRAAMPRGEDKVLLSNESMNQALPRGFRALKELLADTGYRPRFVLGARDVIAHAVSSYRQQVRHHRLAVPLGDYLETERIRTGSALETIAAVFGPDSLRVYPYTPEPAGNIERFLGAVQPGLSLPTESTATTNRSLDALETDIILHLNAAGADPAICRYIADRMTQAAAMPAIKTEPVEIELSAETHDWYCHETDRLNAWLDGDPLEMPRQSVTVSSFAPGGLPPAVQRAAMTMAAMASDNIALREQSDVKRLWRAFKRERDPVRALQHFLRELSR